MQRSVKRRFIAATFTGRRRNTTVAELAIERAKRLSSWTRRGRAARLGDPARPVVQLGSAASAGHLSGGIDSTTHTAEAVLGAARNIENGGSLTILATALVETGSMMTRIFESSRQR